MKVLYVTSFNQSIYQVTGKNLIQSYLDKMSNVPHQDLLVCSEGITVDLPSPIIVREISEDKYLHQWLEKYQNIIPTYHGGKATVESHPQILNSFWLRKTACWFRKIVAIYYAYLNFRYQYDYLIWIDADCRFLQPLPNIKIISLLENHNFFYYLGKCREAIDFGIEAGFWGVDQTGMEIIPLLMECFQSGKFKQFSRWDDGYIMRMLLPDIKKIGVKTLDLVEDNVIFKTRRLDIIQQFACQVMHHGYFKSYIIHDKGTNTKAGIVK